MSNVFFLDACAIIALLAGEKGGENVKQIIQEALDEKIVLKMNQINLLEAYYHICKIYNQEEANKVINKLKEFPIEIVTGLSEKAFNEAGRIKSKYKIPLRDSIIAAECIINNSTLATSDHNDFEQLEEAENLKIYWIR